MIQKIYTFMGKNVKFCIYLQNTEHWFIGWTLLKLKGHTCCLACLRIHQTLINSIVNNH